MIEEMYFDWLLSIINGCKNADDYRKLLSFLHQTEYYYDLPMDGNRYDNGIDLRYHFASEHDISQSEVVATIDSHPCSVLEMLIPIAIKVEEIMYIPEGSDNQVSEWFWIFMDNLGLLGEDDENFSERYVNSVITRFLSREYDRDGTGGIVRITDDTKDCRDADLMMQVMWYLNEF